MATHAVIDGSNLATEGRSAPSLRQLKEAVDAFRKEHPNWDQIVVADATFGHRIDAGEVAEFDRMVENGQIVTPPAGAIGRGDAFVLTIADKAGAVVLSNDSFQEFHGRYAWLFEEGRLIGGKPVPHVGWVFVLRSPVRGPLSRRSVRHAKAKTGAPSKVASEPMPSPKVAPPAKKQAKAARGTPSAPAKAASTKGAGTPAKAAAAAAPKVEEARAKQAALNDLLPFVEFVGNYPVGATIDAEVATFSSHGAYVNFDGIRAYAPLRHLGSPAPRSAREVLTLGERRSFVVVGFTPERRGIDVALPAFVPPGIKVLPDGRRSRAKKRPGAKAQAAKTQPTKAPPAKAPAAKPQPMKAQPTKAPPTKSQPMKAPPTKAPPAKKKAPQAPVKLAATKSPTATPARAVASRKAVKTGARQSKKSPAPKGPPAKNPAKNASVRSRRRRRRGV